MADNSVILNTELRIDQAKLRQSLQQIEQQLKFRGPFGDMVVDTTRFTHELDRATQRVITLGTAFQILSTATRTMHEIARSTIDVQKALNDINVIFRLTNDNLNKFSGNLFSIARETAQSFDEVAKAATEFARQGMSVEKTQQAVRASMMLSRDAGIDVATTIRALTAAVNSFNKEGITHIQVANRIAAADAAFAVSSKDLQEALIRVGSAASDAGVSFNELISLVTAAQQITARGGAVIAGALNTIFTRVNRRDTLDALESLQEGMTRTGGVMLPTLKILENFANAYDKMTGSVKSQAAELVGGVRQLNTLKALLADLSNQTGVFNQNLQNLRQTQNELEQRNLARNLVLKDQWKQLTITGEQIGSNIGNVGGFASRATNIISAVNNSSITDAFRNANDPESAGDEAARMFLKGFGGALMFGLTPIIGGVFFQLSRNVFGNLFKDIKDITLVKSEVRDIAQLEQQIVALYQMGGAPLREQLMLMTDLNAQAAIFAKLLNSARTGETINATALATALVKSGQRPLRAAEGYIPMGEEMSAIARGVGGALPSSRAVFLPHFDRGGGQKGIVANTSEFIVPNMAGGSAIFNRDMIRKYGLPPGSTPVAASGYIPNAAGGSLSDFTLSTLRQASPMFMPQTSVQDPIKVFQDGLNRMIKKGFDVTTLDLNAPAAELRKSLKNLIAQGLQISESKMSDPRISRAIGNIATATMEAQANRIAYYQGIQAMPAIVPPINPSLWQRMSGGMTTTRSLMLGLGLPMVGSNIPEGVAGTSSGMALGATSGAMNFGGFGASAGMMFGPQAALGGLIAGGVMGAFYGAISKATKSFEQLNMELDENLKKTKSGYSAAAEYFNIQDQIADAKARGDMASVVSLTGEGTRILAGMPQHLRAPVIAARNDVRARGTFFAGGATVMSREATGNQLAMAMKLISEGKFTRKEDRASIEGALLNAIQLKYRNDPAGFEAIKKVIDSGNFEELLMGLGTTAGVDLKSIIGSELFIAGERYSTPTYGAFGGSLGTQSNANIGLLRQLFQNAYVGATDIVGSARATINQPAGLGPRQFGDLISGLETRAIPAGINAELRARLIKAQNELSATQPGLSPLQTFDRSTNASRGAVLAESNSQMLALLGEAPSIVAKALQSAGVNQAEWVNKTKGLTDRESIESFLSDFGEGVGITTKGQDVRNAIKGILQSLTRIDAQEKANLKYVEETSSNNRQRLLFTESIKETDQKEAEAAERMLLHMRGWIGIGITQDQYEQAAYETRSGLDFNRTRRQHRSYMKNRPLVLGRAAETERMQVEAALYAARTGSEVESAQMGYFGMTGRGGDATGSLIGGFGARFAGLKKDLYDFSQIGNQIAVSLETGFSNAFGSFVTGAQQAKDAFRSFAVGVLGDASRMFASKAIQGIFGNMFGGLSGSPMGISAAAGGTVPALLTGGEFWVGPNAAKRIGYSTLRQLNGYAEGGLVRGGSGVRDDVPARLPPGSFVVRRGATERLGADYLQALVNGQVQHRFPGGILLGALLGGGLGYAVGGKKGAVIGAGLGALGGHFWGGSGSSTSGAATASGYSTSMPPAGLEGVANEIPIRMDPMYVNATSAASAAASPWSTIGWGLGAAGGLGLAAYFAGRPSSYHAPSYSAIEAKQAELFANNRFAYLSPNSGGGYSLASWGSAPPTRRFSEGGSVDNLIIPGPSNNQSSAVSVKIEINNNGQVSSKSESGGNGGGAFGADFGTKLEKAIRPIVQDELVRQSRNDGFFTQRSRYVTS